MHVFKHQQDIEGTYKMSWIGKKIRVEKIQRHGKLSLLVTIRCTYQFGWEQPQGYCLKGIDDPYKSKARDRKASTSLQVYMTLEGEKKKTKRLRCQSHLNDWSDWQSYDIEGRRVPRRSIKLWFNLMHMNALRHDQ